MLLKGKRVFIVEDNPGNLAIATIYLKQQGATVFFARWGGDALNGILKSLPIDVILMDLMLPENYSGFSIFEELAAVPNIKTIPVIAVSAADADTAIPRAHKLGFTGYIAKPITQRISMHIADALAGKDVWIGDSVFF